MTAWESALAERYEQGRRIGVELMQRHGASKGARCVLADVKAGDLCLATAAGAIDATLEVVSRMTPDERRGYCEPCASGVKHRHDGGEA